MRCALLLALSIAIAGCGGGEERPSSDLTFEELRDTTGVSKGDPLLEGVESYRLPNGVLRIRGRIDFPEKTLIEASIYRKDTKEMVSRVQMTVRNRRFDSPPIMGRRGPLPVTDYRITYRSFFTPSWQPPEVLRATDNGHRLRGPGITRDRVGGVGFYLVEERRL